MTANVIVFVAVAPLETPVAVRTTCLSCEPRTPNSFALIVTEVPLTLDVEVPPPVPPCEYPPPCPNSSSPCVNEAAVCFAD